MNRPALDDLHKMLRPAGGGVHTVTTGRAEQRALQRQLYGVDSDETVEQRWLQALENIGQARVAILGIPADTGAGLVRGQNLAPAAIRKALLDTGSGLLRQSGVVDVGDVRVVPHLLFDDMLSEQTLASVRAALYQGEKLPASPLSIAEHVLNCLLSTNPKLRIVALGGDHSIAWPVVSALAHVAEQPWAIVQPDAHTDLLPERLGIRINFATWAYHANDLLGRQGRLVQVGIRASGKSREHWEQTLGVRQFWANEIRSLGDDRTIDAIVAHLRAIGVRSVYVSNDIDGTDPIEAPATAAPEPHGLASTMVQKLIQRLGQEFSFLGGDVVEVAPLLGHPEGAKKTLTVAASYLSETIQAALGD